jgi:hypothetical protein
MSEEDSGGLDLRKTLARILGRGRRSVLVPSSGESNGDFYQRIWEGGAMEFDPEKVAGELQGEFQERRQWYDEHFDGVWWKPDGIARIREEAAYGFAWRRQFAGRIPARWLDWIKCTKDFEEAGNRNIQMSEVLLNAAVSHPNHLVARTVGETQTLNTEQLTVVLASPLMAEWNALDILAAQRKRGVSEKVIEEAEKRAREIRSRSQKQGHSGVGDGGSKTNHRLRSGN